MKLALVKVKRKKAVEPDGIIMDILETWDDFSIRDILNEKYDSVDMPNDQDRSIIQYI